jgi:hypothetical protein
VVSERLNLREVERKFLSERVKGRTLAEGAWISTRPEERRKVLEAYGLYRCERAMRRLLAYSRALLQAVATASRAAGTVAVEARKQAGRPAPRGAPELAKVVEAAGGFEELAERMDVAYWEAKDLLPKLAAGARMAASEAAGLGCLSLDAVKPVEEALRLTTVKQDPKRNYRWWLPETAQAAFAAAEKALTAYALWRVKAAGLEREVRSTRKEELVEEDLRRYQRVKLLSMAEAQRLDETLKLLEEKA